MDVTFIPAACAAATMLTVNSPVSSMLRTESLWPTLLNMTIGGASLIMLKKL